MLGSLASEAGLEVAISGFVVLWVSRVCEESLSNYFVWNCSRLSASGKSKGTLAGGRKDEEEDRRDYSQNNLHEQCCTVTEVCVGHVLHLGLTFSISVLYQD